MKRLLFTVVAALAAIGVKAQNELAVVPQTVTEAGTFVFVDLNNKETADKVIVMEIDIVWPEGWTIGNPSITHTTARDRYGYYDEDEEAWISPWSIAQNPQPNGSIKYGISGGNSRPLTGSTGHIMRVKVTPPAGTAPGYYPVKVCNTSYIACSGDAGSEIWTGENISYLKVGEPEGCTFVAGEKIPSFVNEALASETGISTLDLSKVTASNGTFTYVDGRKVIAPEGLKGKVAYKRSVSGLASVCLPFAANLKAYTYSSMAGEYAIFDEVSNLAANTPAIVDANIDITVEDATIGSVEAQTITKGYYLKGGKFYSVNGSAVVAPLRGYWELGAGVKGFKFNDADAIMTVDANANEDIFNLNGVKLNKAQRGVNIIGGKKVMK